MINSTVVVATHCHSAFAVHTVIQNINSVYLHNSRSRSQSILRVQTQLIYAHVGNVCSTKKIVKDYKEK